MAENEKIVDGGVSAAARTRGYILVLLSSIVYGVTPVVSQMGYAAGLNSYSLTFGRYVGGALVYIFLIIVNKHSLKITLKQFGYICLVTLSGYSCVLLTFVSYNYLSAGMASLTGMTYIIFTVILEIVLKISKSAAYKWGSLVLSSIGVTLIFLTPDDTGAISTIGLVIGLVAAVLAAIQMILFNSHIIANLPIPTIFLYEVIIPITATPFVAKLLGEAPFPVNATQWGFSLLVALLHLGLGLMLFYSAIRLIGAGNASLVGVTEPIWAFVVGAIVFGDVITGRMLLGGGIILGSIFMLTFFQKRESEKAAAAIAEELETVKAAAQKIADDIIAEQEAKKAVGNDTVTEGDSTLI